MRSAAVFLPRGRKMSSLKEYINNQNEPNNHKEKVLTWSRDLTKKISCKMLLYSTPSLFPKSLRLRVSALE